MKNLKLTTSNLQFTIFSRKIWVVISLTIIFISCCTKTSYEDVISVESPNWTSDGKVVFIKEKEIWKVEEDIGVRYDLVSDSTWLYEINADGSGRENKGLLFDDAEFGGAGLSSAEDWVVFGDGDGSIWVVRRNGTSLQEVGSGRNPDFSPDASKIVYEKSNQGIWIIDRDGGNDHQIISDGKDPAWSPDGERIAFYKDYKGLLVSNTSGSVIDSFNFRHYPDWGPPDSNALVATHYGLDRGVIIYIETHNEDTTGILSGEWPIKWSPYGALFICNKTIYQRNGAEIFSLVP